jgi:hypothetical protein
VTLTLSFVDVYSLIPGLFYFQNVSPTVDGMLGGHAYVSPMDIEASTHFIHEFFEVNKLHLWLYTWTPHEIQIHKCFLFFQDNGGFLKNDYALGKQSNVKH